MMIAGRAVAHRAPAGGGGGGAAAGARERAGNRHDVSAPAGVYPPVGQQVLSEARTRFSLQQLVSGSHELMDGTHQARFGVMYANDAVDDTLKVRGAPRVVRAAPLY